MTGNLHDLQALAASLAFALLFGAGAACVIGATIMAVCEALTRRRDPDWAAYWFALTVGFVGAMAMMLAAACATALQLPL